MQNAVFRPEKKICALKKLAKTASSTVLANVFYDLIFKILFCNRPFFAPHNFLRDPDFWTRDDPDFAPYRIFGDWISLYTSRDEVFHGLRPPREVASARTSWTYFSMVSALYPRSMGTRQRLQVRTCGGPNVHCFLSVFPLVDRWF